MSDVMIDVMAQHAKAIRTVLDGQDVAGPAWILVNDGQAMVCPVTDPDNDLALMMVATRVERETGLRAEVKPFALLSPAEQATLRARGKQI